MSYQIALYGVLNTKCFLYYFEQGFSGYWYTTSTTIIPVTRTKWSCEQVYNKRKSISNMIYQFINIIDTFWKMCTIIVLENICHRDPDSKVLNHQDKRLYSSQTSFWVLRMAFIEGSSIHNIYKDMLFQRGPMSNTYCDHCTVEPPRYGQSRPSSVQIREISGFRSSTIHLFLYGVWRVLSFI